MVASQTATTGAIELTASDLVKVNKGQLIRGRNALGDIINPTYRSQEYAKEKYSRNPTAGYGNPDLYDTGSFYNSIRFHIEGTIIKWESTDSKAPDLLAKYGSVLGVYENIMLQEYRKSKLYPLMRQIIKAETGL